VVDEFSSLGVNRKRRDVGGSSEEKRLETKGGWENRRVQWYIVIFHPALIEFAGE
jgi:hypothetical protein